MTTKTMDSTRSVSPYQHHLPWLVILFIGSGCAALIYEIVWFQMLSLIVGSSAISLGVLLGTFMGGMCIGSIGLSKVVATDKHPLRVYAKLEAGIGIFGLLVLWLLPHIGGLYTSIGGPGMLGIMVRAVFCCLFLLPPTIMMGATLPAISRWVETTPRGVSWLGFFYGGNTFGAVLGQADKNKENILLQFGDLIGKAFQITDDILDVNGNEKIIGKKINKDKSRGKLSLIDHYGIEGARNEALNHINEAQKLLDIFGDKATHLLQLTEYILNRRK